jgi:hypothetical protein
MQVIRCIGHAAEVVARACTPLSGTASAWFQANFPGKPVQLTVEGLSLPASARLCMPNPPVIDGKGRAHLRAALTADAPEAHVVRRRVHRPVDLLALVEALKVAVVVPAEAKRLKTVALGGPAHAAIFQDGSDWDLLGISLAEYRRLGKVPDSGDVTVTGGVGPVTAGKWVLTPRDPRAYQGDDRTGRTVRFTDEDGTPGEWGEALTMWPAARGSQFTCVARLFRPFQPGTFADWVTRDVPLFLETPDGEVFVVGAVDELRWPGPAWHTALVAAVTAVGLPGPLDAAAPRPWSGPAKLVADTGVQPFAELEIPGFDAGYNRFNVRRLTSTDGKQGDGGESRVVYADAIAKVNWSGRFDDEADFGYVRRRKAAEASNLTALDDPHVMRLKSVRVPECGGITCESDVNVSGTKHIAVTGDDVVVGTTGSHIHITKSMVDTVE